MPLPPALRLGAVLTFAVACTNPAGPPSVQDILLHQATWARQGLADYSYTYEFSALNAFANQPLRLEVRQDTVRSVVVVATGQSIDPTFFPTIDGLFERVLAAAHDGSLTHIEFDPQRGYPRQVTYAAIPDALSSQQATDLQPVP